MSGPAGFCAEIPWSYFTAIKQRSGQSVTNKVNLPRDPKRSQRQTELVLEYRRSGSQAAFLELLKSIDGLIAMTIRRYFWTGIHSEDLNSEAIVGILRAIDRFDAEAGPFSAFCLAYIHGAVGDAVSRAWAAGTISNSRVEKRLHTQGSRRYHQLIDEGRSSAQAIETVASELGLQPFHVAQAMGLHQRADIRIDLKVDDAADFELVGDLGDRAFEDIAARDTANVLRDVLAELPERHRKIIEMRYLTRDVDEPSFVSLDTIGREIGVTRERIRRQHDQAMKMLRAVVKKRGLRLEELI